LNRGIILQIDVAAEKCLVNIDSGETVWALFKDLKTWTIDIDESPVKCNLCQGTQSRKNNVVVTCEVCFRGYHQKCYQVRLNLVTVLFSSALVVCTDAVT